MGGAGILPGIWFNPAGAVQISGSTLRLCNDVIGKLLRFINTEYISRVLKSFAYNAFLAVCSKLY